MLIAFFAIAANAQGDEAPQSASSPLSNTVRAINFKNVSRESLIDPLSRAAGVPIHIDWDAVRGDRSFGFDARLDGCTIEAALNALFDDSPCFDSGAIVVASPSSKAPTVKVQYAVGDIDRAISPLPGVGASQLLDAIRRMIAPDTWKDNGGECDLFFNGDVLSVTHNIAGQEAVQSLLQVIRDAQSDRPKRPDRGPMSEFAVLGRPLADAKFTNLSLHEIIARLASQAHLNIVVNCVYAQVEGINFDDRFDIDLSGLDVRQALLELLWSVGGNKIAFRFHHGVIVIDSAERLATETTIEMYRTGPLLKRIAETPSPRRQYQGDTNSVMLSHQDMVDSITKLLEEDVSTDSWKDNGGAVGSLAELGDQMLVQQSPPAQRFVAELLAAVTDALAADPQVEPTTKPAPEIPNTKIGEINFDATPFEQALSELADKSGVRIFVNWQALQAAGVNRDTPVSVRLPDTTLRKALAVVIAVVQEKEPPTCAAETDKIIRIGAGPGTVPVVLRLYQIQPLIDATLRGLSRSGERGRDPRPSAQDAIDNISRAIEEYVDPDSWRDNGGIDGSLRAIGNVLIIRATPGTQDKVDAFLKKLKREMVSSNLPAQH